jgi:DNA-binding NtrC family response regulator
VAAVILIVGREAVISALVGSLIELAGHHPTFAEPGEATMEAMGRVVPDLLLLDCSHDDACVASLYEHAVGMHTPILLFTPARGCPAGEQFAAARGVATLALPAQADIVSRAIDEALRTVH